MAPLQEADHYEVLGLPLEAPLADVKKAYRALSKQCHPDKAGNVPDLERKERERRMIAVNAAYAVLASPRQRREYDLSRDLAPTPASTASWPAVARPRCRPRSSGTSQRQPPPPQPPQPEAQASQLPSARRGSGIHLGAAKPRYQSAGKYSLSARQARRMDPAQYTQHVDGRHAEFAGSGDAAGLNSAPGLMPGEPRNPAWLQRQLDAAHEWERLHCPPDPAEEGYKWAKASEGWLKDLRERRAQRASASEPTAAVE